MRKIPFGRPLLDEREKQAVRDVLDGDILVHGPRAKQFDKDFAEKIGVKHAISVSSCTAGLHLYYFSRGIGVGDEVIVPAQTHVATAHAVSLCGAKPVFVDCEPLTGNIDLDQIEEKITPSTRAISIVHFLGMPVDMNRLLTIADKHGLEVLEDCALALGTRFQGKHAGTLGIAGAFSFYPVKHITSAEGGMITTNDDKLAARLIRQKAFGVDRTVSERQVPGVYDVDMLGFNYRMSEVHAAIGIEQLKKADAFLKIREQNYHHLASALKGITDITLLESTQEDFVSSYYCLSIVLSASLRASRLEIVKYLNDNGVGTSVYYPHPVPLLKFYNSDGAVSPANYPNASAISYGSIALPVGAHLNMEDMEYIGQQVKVAIQSVRK